MKKALVISPQPFFSPRGTPFSVYYRTAVMANKNIDIDLLTYGEGQDVDIPRVRIIRIPKFPLLGNVKVGPSILKLFLDVFILIWAVRLLHKNKYDFVHAHEEAIFICRFLKFHYKFKMIYDMHSSLPQQLSNFKYTESKLIKRLFEKMENSCLKSADAVITICPDLYDYVNSVIDRKEKHILIENSLFDKVKLKTGSPGLHDPSSKKEDVEEEPVDLPTGKRFVVYVGTLEPYQGIHLLIGAFREVVREIPDAFLLVVGGTVEQVRLYRQMATEAGLGDHCRFTGRVSQPLAKHYMKIASILVSPRSSGTNTPLKIYEYLASGIPIIATDIHSHTQVLNEDVAYLVKPDARSMAEGISSALNGGEKATQVIASARKLYEEKYSREIYEAKIEKLLDILA
jgi:glycosyltransferase involved in cell wall biosynthesis